MSEINPMNNKKYIEAVSFRDWQTCDLICDEHSVLVDRIKNLEQELQKTREQLKKVEEVLRTVTESAESLMTLGDRYTEHGQNIVDARQYFKDKQGE